MLAGTSIYYDDVIVVLESVLKTKTVLDCTSFLYSSLKIVEDGLFF